MNKYNSTSLRGLALVLFILAFCSLGQAQQKETLAVSGACGMCTNTIQKTAKNVNGVLKADYNLDQKLLTLEIDPAGFDKQTLSDALNAKGYDTALGKAENQIYDDLPGCCQYREMESHQTGSSQMEMAQDKITLKVSGACGMCKNTILKTAKNVNGVIKADYDLDQMLLTLEVDPSGFNKQTLSDALNAKGYDTSLGKAADEIYDNLPGCCQYREMEAHLSEGDHQGHEHGVQHTHAENPSAILSGYLVERLEDGSDLPLIGATLQWEDAPTGATTDVNGEFEIGRIDRTDNLIFSYVGYQSDTVDVSHVSKLYHIMNSNLVMNEVVIKHRKNTSEISFIKPIQTINVSEEELCKAACCSLSESFETSPSIDVSFTDAVTGTRQIQMLGLAGKYVQITRELIPDVRSVGSIGGLSLTPGAWVQSIQLSKGTGSVANGFESMTGQINVELRKPEADENLFVNLYGNAGGRYESNLFSAHKLNKNLSTAFLLHSGN